MSSCSVKGSSVAGAEAKGFVGARRPLVASGTRGPGLGWGEMRSPCLWKQLLESGRGTEEPTSQPSLTTYRGLLSRTLASASIAPPVHTSWMLRDLSRTQGCLASPEAPQ